MKCKATIKDILSRFGSNDRNSAELLMTLRIIANMMYQKGSFDLLFGDSIEIIIATMLFGLAVAKTNKQYAGIHTTSIAIMYSISLQLRPEHMEDFGAQLISAILHHVESEEEGENLYWMLMTLGRVLFTNDDGVLLTNALGFNLSQLKDKQCSKTSVKVRNITADVESLLK